MEFIFPANGTTDISFKLSIAGTNTSPSEVQVCLRKEDVVLSFIATFDDNRWTASIHHPGLYFANGKIDMSISVSLSGRQYVPFRTEAQIISDAVAPASVDSSDIKVTKTVEPVVVPTVMPPDPVPTVMASPEVNEEIIENISEAPIEIVNVVEPVASNRHMFEILKQIEPTTERVREEVAPIIPKAKKRVVENFSIKRKEIIAK